MQGSCSYASIDDKSIIDSMDINKVELWKTDEQMQWLKGED